MLPAFWRPPFHKSFTSSSFLPSLIFINILAIFLIPLFFARCFSLITFDVLLSASRKLFSNVNFPWNVKLSWDSLRKYYHQHNKISFLPPSQADKYYNSKGLASDFFPTFNQKKSKAAHQNRNVEPLSFDPVELKTYWFGYGIMLWKSRIYSFFYIYLNYSVLPPAD